MESPADTGPESYLPGSSGEWEFQGTSQHGHGWAALGAKNGTIGHYEGPDGKTFAFVVMDMNPDYTEGAARSLDCAGWLIALDVDDTAIAASTGTEQRSFTPEKPPTMGQSPVPDSTPLVRELLALSPRLDESKIEANHIDCGR